MTGEGITLLSLEVIRSFQILTLCLILVNKMKISGGGGVRTPGPPSGSAHAKYKVFSYFAVTITCTYMYNKIAELLGCKLSNLAHVQQNAHHLP